MNLNIKNDESQLSKKKQKKNLLIGIFGIIISTFVIIIISIYYKISLFIGLIYMISFMINIVMIVSSASSLSDKKDNLRYIYFKLLELLHMKDWPYDKRYSISSKLYYDYHSEGFSYKTEIKNKRGKIKRISNSIDAFRLGHSSNIKIFGIPINNQIMKKKLIKLYYTKFDFETVEINFKTSWLKNIIAVITILLIIFFGFFIV